MADETSPIEVIIAPHRTCLWFGHNNQAFEIFDPPYGHHRDLRSLYIQEAVLRYTLAETQKQIQEMESKNG